MINTDTAVLVSCCSMERTGNRLEDARYAKEHSHKRKKTRHSVYAKGCLLCCFSDGFGVEDEQYDRAPVAASPSATPVKPPNKRKGRMRGRGEDSSVRQQRVKTWH